MPKHLTWKGKKAKGSKEEHFERIFEKRCNFTQFSVEKQIKNCYFICYLKQEIAEWCTFYNSKVYTIFKFNSFHQKIWKTMTRFRQSCHRATNSFENSYRPPNVLFWKSNFWNSSLNLRRRKINKKTFG